MLRRRRNVLFAALLLGLVWIVVMPLFSKDDSAVTLHGQHRHLADGLDIPEGSQPLQRTARNTQEHLRDMVANAGNDDDLSEIEFPQPELPVNSFFGKVKSTVRPAYREVGWLRASRHNRHGRVTSSAPVATSKFDQSHQKRVNAPGKKGVIICLCYIHSCIFWLRLLY